MWGQAVVGGKRGGQWLVKERVSETLGEGRE